MSETPEDEKTVQTERIDEPATAGGGIGASTRRFANHPVGRWVAASAAVVVALFSGVLIGRATEQDSADAGPASFGRPDGDGPPDGGQAPFQHDEGFGDQGGSSGGSVPSPMQSGQS